MKPKLKPVNGIMSICQNSQHQCMPFDIDRAYLNKDAATNLYSANIQLMNAGGRLIVTSMWRTPGEQMKYWHDWSTGRKTSFSPPPGRSMHECGRAVDIDVREESLKIPHEEARKILALNNWVPIVPIGEPGDSHYEYRNPVLQKEKSINGYLAMVKLAFSSYSKQQSILYSGIDYAAIDAGTEPKWL